jgi:hypothetical protein
MQRVNCHNVVHTSAVRLAQDPTMSKRVKQAISPSVAEKSQKLSKLWKRRIVKDCFGRGTVTGMTRLALTCHSDVQADDIANCR